MSYNTALIVDDSKLARFALKKKLEQRGLKIVMAEDAKQALGLLENTSIDIVFMDHLMPDMDGFEATLEIKANAATAHLPVIMCSGKEKQGYLEEARAIGASNVLPKPAENEAIAAVFAELEELAPGAESESTAAGPIDELTLESTFGEAQVQGLLQPMAGQLDEVSSQCSALAQEIDHRFGVVADTLQSIEDKQLAVEPVDMRGLSEEWRAQMDQRFASLEIPDAEQMQSQLKQALGTELRLELDEHWDNSLKAAVLDAMSGLEQLVQAAQNESDQGAAVVDERVAALEERLGDSLTASFTQLLEDKGHQLEASVQQQLDSLRAELSRELADALSAVNAEVDLEALKQSLKAELIEEMGRVIDDSSRIEIEDAGEQADLEIPEQGPEAEHSPAQQLRREIRFVKVMAFGCSLLASAAIALHWM